MEILAGMRDIEGAELFALDGLRQNLQGLLSGYGYQLLETPLLEKTEIYLRKAGGEFSAKLYAFSEPGGERVSLRPEFTASVIRYFVGNSRKIALPARYQYAGPVLRYEEPSEGQYRQFHQVGAELIGSASPRADAEVLTLVSQCLSQVGLTGCRVAMSHVGMMSRLFEALQISEAAQMFLLTSLPELSNGGDSLSSVRQKAKERGLLQAGQPQRPWASLLNLMGEAEARALVGELVQGLGEDALGQRLSEEVVEGFLQRMRGSEDDSRLERALKLASELAPIHGEPAHVLKESAKVLTSFELDASCQGSFKEALSFLDGLPSIKLEVNFGLFRGIAYYSGIIFDVYPPQPSDSPLGGGGRYDGLIRAMGGQTDVAALGFALTLERIAAALSNGRGSSDVDSRSHRILVVPKSNSAYEAAIEMAEALRREGRIVEVDVVERALEKSLEYAKAKGIKEILLVHPDKRSQRVSLTGRRS